MELKKISYINWCLLFTILLIHLYSSLMHLFFYIYMVYIKESNNVSWYLPKVKFNICFGALISFLILLLHKYKNIWSKIILFTLVIISIIKFFLINFANWPIKSIVIICAFLIYLLIVYLTGEVLVKHTHKSNITLKGVLINSIIFILLFIFLFVVLVGNVSMVP